MSLFQSAKTKELEALRAQLSALQERSNLLDEACGIGLWEALLHNGDAMHAESKWTWSLEFRRLIGYQSSQEFPDVVQSWSDRLHPDDIAPTFAAFGGHLLDKTDKTRYDVIYRLKVRDGSYRWFRATGGCKHQPDGTTIRACGSLKDIHDEVLLQEEGKRAAAEDQAAINALSEALEALSSGDLTHRITAPIGSKAEKLKVNFNRAGDRLQGLLQSVSVVVTGMSDGTQEIRTATDDLSRRTEQQAVSLEQTAAALDEITANVRSSSQRTEEARGVAGMANTSAAKSGEVVSKAVDAMSRIEDSSKQISNIIGVIDEIAFQTNLLALNAGVEAARAGEAGRGFAVVAQEVRELAQRSAKAAKEIKELIQNSSTEVGNGVNLVRDTGEVLKTIESHIVTMNQHMETIARSAQEQALGLSEVNAAINKMDQVTQQNASMVQETTGSADSLANDAAKLSDLVAQFNLGGQSGRSNPVRALQNTARRMAEPSRAPAPAPRKVAGGGATEAWSEF